MNLPRLSEESERVMAAATHVCVELGHSFLGVEHLFLGLADVMRADLVPAFASQKQDLSRFVDTLQRRMAASHPGGDGDELQPTPRAREVFGIAARVAARAGKAVVEPPHLLEAILVESRSVPLRLLRAFDFDVAVLQQTLAREPAAMPSPTPLLAQFGRDLTALARQGRLSPLIGRDEELDLVAQVLLRKNKNNPVLVGEAGVGKTAVVEGFAQRLVADDCPEPLRGRRLIELSLPALVAGTKFRGEFEERLLGIAKEVRAHPDVVLFLDEIHALVGAGATGGGDSMDASNILKPALARGEIRCIGATTMAEWRRHIEPDPALERRFEKVLVDEPSADETLAILDRLRPSFESHHQVRIHPEAVRAAVDLTLRHVRDRQLPDKAIDAIDQSCARKRLSRYAAPDRAEPRSVASDDVRARDVARTVSRWTGIPLERISGDDARRLLGLEDELGALVLGQPEAVRIVARTVLTAKAGLSEPGRPLGVFFFAGPTGVGKTHLARSLAQVLFGGEQRLVRLDMSEYMEEHSIANLIGAPPGYVGHEREGILISALRTHPHSVVLFDEVEKAHPKLFDLFLQIFDDGRLTGTHGRTADFTQAVVVMTSNIDTRPAGAPIGFGQAGTEPGGTAGAADPRDVLLAHLRPELVNRLDAVVPFEPLSPEALRRIIDGYVRGIGDLLAQRSLALDLDDAVYAHLLEGADTERFGARELRRLVDRELRQPLARFVLEHGERAGGVRARVGPEGVVLEAMAGRDLPA